MDTCTNVCVIVCIYMHVYLYARAYACNYTCLILAVDKSSNIIAMYMHMCISNLYACVVL